MSNKDVSDVLNGSIEPDTPTNLVEIQRWKRACETLFSVHYLVTTGPAATLVRQYEDRTSAGGLGHGQKAWDALYTKYNSNSKEARRACYEKLVSFRMEEGRGPDDYTIKLMEVRGRLHEMGEKILDERFEDILLQGLTDDYEFVKMTSFHTPNFGINEIQSMMRNLHIDRLSRPGHVNKLAGSRAAMTTTKGSRKGRCYNCQKFGHIKRDCTNSKEERSATQNWYSLHNPTTHSDAECNAQNGKHNTDNKPQGEVQSAHTATESTATEEEDDFGYAFVTSGWTPSAEFQETAQPTERRESSADTLRLAPKALTMLVDSETSGHYFDDELHPGLKDKLLNYKPLERPHKILTAGRHVLPGTATGTISGKIIDTDGNKHPVEHAGLVAPGRRCFLAPLLLLLLLSNLEDKTCAGVLYGYSLNSNAYQKYRYKTARLTESPNVTFIETPASTLADSTGGNTTGDAVSTHEDSSLAENSQDICITYSEEIDSLLKKVSKLTGRNSGPLNVSWRGGAGR